MQIDVEELKKLAPEGALEGVNELTPDGPIYLFKFSEHITCEHLEFMRKQFEGKGIRAILLDGSANLEIYQLKVAQPQ